MLATKNRGAGRMFLLLGAGMALAGCAPPGPRALLDGQRLLDQGRYPQAVARLEQATALLKTNAQAWNYLGVAYHRAGQPTNAVQAYRKAVTLNQNLAEARYNLGCLWLEQNRADLAREQFTTYTLLPLERGQAIEGFLKLGTAQLRLRETAAAEESFSRARRLDAQNAEAFNGLGLAQVQRHRPREAAQFFHTALKHRPSHRPALLNLATVLYRHHNDVPGALEKYREYLALQPRAADWDAVQALVQSLESPAARPRAAIPVPSPARGPATNELKTPIARAPASTRTNTLPVIVKTSPPPAATQSPPVVEKLPPEPVIRSVPDAATTSAPARVAEPAAGTSAPPVLISAPPPAKRGLLQRLNPFRREPAAKPQTGSAPAPTAATTSAGTSPERAAPLASPPPQSTPYKYLNPPSPGLGDRAAAERAFAQGSQSQRANRPNEAAAAYKQAVQLDPSYFEAHYNLGLIAYELRNYRQSLAAWEGALAARPDSADARYNFALALKAAGHQRDAANELVKILATHPNDARAHLVLGNLYADTLRDPARARTHYQKVLELDSRHPQATAIRYWLVDHPR